jgi:hypothetical protein
MKDEKITKEKKTIEELTNIIHDLTGIELQELINTGAVDTLLKAIIDPLKVEKYPNIAEFLLYDKRGRV